MDFQQHPTEMNKHLDVIKTNSFTESGLVLGASCLVGSLWHGSLWYYSNPEDAGKVDECSAGVSLPAGVGDVAWVKANGLAVALDNGAVALWNLCEDKANFEFGQTLCHHDNVVTSVSLSADNSQLISTSLDGSINLCDLETRELLRSYSVHHDAVFMAVSHPTLPRVFVSCGLDGLSYLWDMRTKRPAKPIVEHSKSAAMVTCMDWKPGSDYTIAAGNELGEITIKDLASPKMSSLPHKCHRLAPTRLQFSQHRPSLLASVSKDCSLVVSDVDGSDMTTRLKDTRHDNFIRGVTWYGADSLLTCSWDGKVLSHVCNGSPVNQGRRSDMKTDET